MAPLKVAVVGGGITGLAAAHRAVEIARERGVPLELTLLEARERLGGTIRTERHDGFLIEHGPDSFLTEKPAAVALCRRLRIESLLVGTDDRFRKTYVLCGGTMHALPDGFQLLAPTRLLPFACSELFSWRGKLRMALDLVLPRRNGADESLASFVRRRLGREALERVAEPLIGGIYAADPEDLSVAAALPRFRELERRDRSLIWALWRAGRRTATSHGASGPRWSLFVTFRNGLSDFVDALAARLPPGAVRVGTPVRGIARDGAAWRVVTDGDVVRADRVIVATEAHAASRALGALDPELGRLLGEIPYVGAAVVSLGYRRDQIRHPLDGFGFVVPATEGKAILACTFSSVKFPDRAPDGHALLRCFMARPVLGESDATLVERARAEIGAALGVTAEPRVVRLHRHAAAMPQYHLGHLARIDAIDRRVAALPGLALAGAGYRGLGISECVRTGEAVAEAMLTGGVETERRRDPVPLLSTS
ncbi:MAG: protoporphyrinogen oxidase [Candidatus Rokubacteria bacterium]|nr:protoporphyrinogen oxidase [Candidatus Rokubacteria bacterium]